MEEEDLRGTKIERLPQHTLPLISGSGWGGALFFLGLAAEVSILRGQEVTELLF